MKYLLWTLLILFILIFIGTILFPVIVSVITFNWWYLFLYFAIWIPASIEVIIMSLIVSLLKT